VVAIGNFFFTLSTNKNIMTTPCFLDTMPDRSRPVKESCFSNTQIDRLFEEWSKFVRTKRDVTSVQLRLTNSKDRYLFLRFAKESGEDMTTPALNQPDQKWIHETPTGASSFIQYIRKQNELMRDLQMALQPVMRNSSINDSDMQAVLDRYQYWLLDGSEKRVTILGVNTKSDSLNVIQQMINKLRQEWDRSRFHVAALFEDSRWKVVLIEKSKGQYSSTVEFFDPGWQAGDTSALRMLVQAALDLNPNLVEHSPQTYNRSPKRDCSVMSLLFVHFRLVQDKDWGTAVDEIRKESRNCDLRLKQFFWIPPEGTADGTNHSTFKKYDMRIAVVVFINRLAMLQSTVEDAFLAEFIGQKIQDAQLALHNPPVDYNRQTDILESRMYQIQAELTIAIRESKSVGVTISWESAREDVFRDPLTNKLRSLRGDERQQSAKKILGELIDWRYNETVGPTSAGDIDNMLASLVKYYVSLWIFDERKIENSTPEMFLKATMVNQSIVSLGVQFLRSINEWLLRTGLFAPYIMSAEINTRYGQKLDFLIKPFNQKTMPEYRQVISECDHWIREARSFLQRHVPQLELTKPIRSVLDAPVVPGVTNPLLPTQASTGVTNPLLPTQASTGVTNPLLPIQAPVVPGVTNPLLPIQAPVVPGVTNPLLPIQAPVVPGVTNPLLPTRSVLDVPGVTNPLLPTRSVLDVPGVTNPLLPTREVSGVTNPLLRLDKSTFNPYQVVPKTALIPPPPPKPSTDLPAYLPSTVNTLFQPSHFANPTAKTSVEALTTEALERFRGAQKTDTELNLQFFRNRLAQVYQWLGFEQPNTLTSEYENITQMAMQALSHYGLEAASKETLDGVDVPLGTTLLRFVQGLQTTLPVQSTTSRTLTTQKKARMMLYVFYTWVMSRYQPQAVALTSNVYQSVTDALTQIMSAPEVFRNVVRQRLEALYQRFGFVVPQNHGGSESLVLILQDAIGTLGGKEVALTSDFAWTMNKWGTLTAPLANYLREGKGELQDVTRLPSKDKVLLFLYAMVSFVQYEMPKMAQSSTTSSTTAASAILSQPDQISFIMERLKGLFDAGLRPLRQSSKFESWYFPLDATNLTTEYASMFAWDADAVKVYGVNAMDMGRLTNNQDFGLFYGLNVLEVIEMVRSGVLTSPKRERDMLLVATSLQQQLKAASNQNVKSYFCELTNELYRAMLQKSWPDASPAFNLLGNLVLIDCPFTSSAKKYIGALHQKYQELVNHK
jgi:hypothetical protein